MALNFFKEYYFGAPSAPCAATQAAQPLLLYCQWATAQSRILACVDLSVGTAIPEEFIVLCSSVFLFHRF